MIYDKRPTDCKIYICMEMMKGHDPSELFSNSDAIAMENFFNSTASGDPLTVFKIAQKFDIRMMGLSDESKLVLYACKLVCNDEVQSYYRSLGQGELDLSKAMDVVRDMRKNGLIPAQPDEDSMM